MPDAGDARASISPAIWRVLPFLLSCFAIYSCSMPESQAQILADCHDPAVANAVAQARAAYPDTYPDWGLARNAFVHKNRWEFFDANNDGVLDFDEFLKKEWASYLSQVPAGHCTVNRREFFRQFLGDPKSPISGWRIPENVASIGQMYYSLDLFNKGYITEDDIRSRAKVEYNFSYRKHADAIFEN